MKCGSSFRRFFHRTVLIALLAAGPCWALSAPPSAGEWQESPPAMQGVDTQKLTALRSLLEGAPHIRSLVLVRNDRLIFEYYGNGVGREDLHDIASVTKSVTSSLVGIALDKQHLRSLDQKVVDLIPEIGAPGADPRVNDVTLKHVLTMTTVWDDRTFTPNRWANIDNQIEFLRTRPVAYAAGEAFHYDTSGAQLLSIILNRVTKASMAKYAEEHLFGPLGITRYGWQSDKQGNNAAGLGLQLRTRDMAKVGNLYLRRGAWNGQQIISAEYVDAATRKQMPTGVKERGDYGYMWWVPEAADGKRDFFAMGYGGQTIYVAPDLNLVVALTASQNIPLERNRAITRELIFPLIRESIMPAVSK